MTILSRGSIRKRSWLHEGQKRTSFEFTIVVERDGGKKRIRRTCRRVPSGGIEPPAFELGTRRSVR